MRAFTLIEILLTLVIIGLGVSWGVTNLDKLQRSVSEKTLQGRLKQLGIAKQQFIQESNRVEAEQTWAATTTSQAHYNILKRYIERPVNSFSEVAPRGCTIITPSSVWNSYTGYGPTGTAFTEGN